MANCQECSGAVRKPLKPACSVCKRSLLVCRRCFNLLNDETTGYAKVIYHCQTYRQTYRHSETGKRCKATVQMRWTLPGEDPEALKRRIAKEEQELAALMKRVEARRQTVSSSESVGSCSSCPSGAERLTIQKQVEHLAGWKKRPCTCTEEHTSILARGRGRLIPIPTEEGKRKKLNAGLATYAMRRMMQIHKICTPTGSTEAAIKARPVREAYLNGTICLTILEKKGVLKLLLTENVTQTSSRFLCGLKTPDEWVHEPDPIRYHNRDKTDAHYYLHRLCTTEKAKMTTAHSGVNKSCIDKHASVEIEGPVHIRNQTYPGGYSLHHAEMQAVHYAFRFGWRILAMAPSRPCCAVCAGTLEGLGLMSVVRHPTEWGFGTDADSYQVLSNTSDEAYLKIAGALKNQTADDFADLRERLRKRLVGETGTSQSVNVKRKHESLEEKGGEETDEGADTGRGIDLENQEDASSFEPKPGKKRTLALLSTSEENWCDALLSTAPFASQDQIEALTSKTPTVEMCDVPRVETLPEEFLSFFDEFEYGVEAAEEEGHDPREVLGITNSGNSCYLNSVLQLLIHTATPSGLGAALGTHAAQTLTALLNYFGTKYLRQAAHGTYVQESDTCYYTTARVDDVRTVLYDARAIGGMYSQEDAILALEHILQAHALGFTIRVTKRYHLDAAKIVPVAPDTGANADDHGNTVVDDVRRVLRLSLAGLNADTTLDAVIDANWSRDYTTAPVPTDTRVNNQGHIYQNVALLREDWAWAGGAAPAHFFLGLDRFYFAEGAAGKYGLTVDVPLQLTKWGVNYSLYGFFAHIGATVREGHYVSYIRSPSDANRWYRISDEDVTELAHDAAALTQARGAGYGYFYGP